MKAIEELLRITEQLLGPGGCPWDQQQTLASMRGSVLEETCELIEAIDLDDHHHIAEELGDLFFNAIFLCKLGEKEGKFTLDEVVQEVANKLVRRHPHVFGDKKIEGISELYTQWEEIKSQEKGKDKRTSVLDGISKGLPALTHAQKSIKKVGKYALVEGDVGLTWESEEALGDFLLQVAAQASKQGLDCEQALRKTLSLKEQQFRKWEQEGQ